jgi:hypothetical protein
MHEMHECMNGENILGQAGYPHTIARSLPHLLVGFLSTSYSENSSDPSGSELNAAALFLFLRMYVCMYVWVGVSEVRGVVTEGVFRWMSD